MQRVQDFEISIPRPGSLGRVFFWSGLARGSERKGECTEESESEHWSANFTEPCIARMADCGSAAERPGMTEVEYE